VSTGHLGTLIAATLALSGCVTAPGGIAPISEAAQPRFDAIAFFSGTTNGTGLLKKAFSKTVPVLVEGRGTVKDGVLYLEQDIREGEKPVRTRNWVIREDRPDHYTGTLTDAEGAVEGRTDGNRLHLSFTMNGGFPVEQRLTLSPDGQRAYNVMKVRKLGVTVAVLAEDIRRLE
jgi:hypothetical protein